jgi:MerR family regulatory protein
MEGVYGDSAKGITIGQLAEYAGVTIKAVRHYHRRGLLPEPPRDVSGYRRYTVEDAIALVKIRTLAEVRTRDDQFGHKRGSGQQVLEVVKDQQSLPSAE